ncbi:MAG TPA: winged helix-turn-helix domain-containing protein [Flavisolibacter sp.]|nr:winged helix-turn-helix domain-containing protein [Flavisolibacter sp.]
MGESDGYNSSKREILLRRIGHEMLLQSGDSTSRVLPIKKAGENEYQISFENELSFQPDSLVNTIRRLLAKDLDVRDYIVSVRKGSDASMVYGYAISRDRKDDIIACLGRKQPKAGYLINIAFRPVMTNMAKNWYLLGCLALLAVIGYVCLRPGKPRDVLPGGQSAIPRHQAAKTQDQSAHIFSLGSFLFDAQHRKLLLGEKTIDLTGTESRVLLVFAMSPNEVIERSRLQKEIWEDEGVIVGRSLDMFISKLRKKLEGDPAVSIVVIRGKGYKLQINA